METKKQREAVRRHKKALRQKITTHEKYHRKMSTLLGRIVYVANQRKIDFFDCQAYNGCTSIKTDGIGNTFIMFYFTSGIFGLGEGALSAPVSILTATRKQISKMMDANKLHYWKDSGSIKTPVYLK